MSAGPLIQIKHRHTNAVLFEAPADSMRECAEAAARTRADLMGANLSGANLSGADLRAADLMGANLSGANLSGADLVGADLVGANLVGAYLSGAYLSGAYLVGANLVGANLRGAYLSGAYLSGAIWHEDVKLNRAPVVECSRTDGYRFLLLDCDVGWRVQAGCRFLSLPDAWAHWETTRAGTPLGDETFDILVLFEHAIERAGGRP